MSGMCTLNCFASSRLVVSDFCLLLHRLKLIAARPSVGIILNWIVHAHISFRGDKDHEKYVRPEFSQGFGRRRFASVVFWVRFRSGGIGFDETIPEVAAT